MFPKPVKLFTYGPRSFAVAGPTTWYNLPEYLRDPELSSFNRQFLSWAKNIPVAPYRPTEDDTLAH